MMTQFLKLFPTKSLFSAKFIVWTYCLLIACVLGCRETPRKETSHADVTKQNLLSNAKQTVAGNFSNQTELHFDSAALPSFLEKYPEFQDRLCVLPSQLGVSPDDVVKYHLRARTMMEWTILWSRTAIITGLFAMVLLNLYYRLLVDSLPQQAA